MSRPALRQIPLAQILPLGVAPEVIVTMSRGQWDRTLENSYEAGFVLLELDEDERPLCAYQREGA